MHHSFQELMLRAKAGDRDAFGILYETHLTPLYRYVLLRTRDTDETEDIVQETFLKAYEAIPRYEQMKENFLPYLFTVARNLMINRTRRSHTVSTDPTTIDREEGSESASSLATKNEDLALTEKALAGLNDTEREIVVLRFYGEQPYNEIATLCEKTEENVRQIISRAMKKMRMNLIAQS
jgi:RNA polymerase sigma-70 factor (ECF subfamily)